MGRQGHFILRYKDLLHILHRQSTEQCNTESSCSDLNNSVVVENVSGNTRNGNQYDSRLVLVLCMQVLMVRVRVQVRVRYFRVRVLKMCTRELLEYEYQVLQLCRTVYSLNLATSCRNLAIGNRMSTYPIDLHFGLRCYL